MTKILRNVKDFNIEITDNLGRTALRLATENEHLEIVQVLLSKSDSQKIREILLLAIFLGYTAIVEAILMHPKYKVLNEKKFMNGEDSFWQTPSSDDAQFSPDITVHASFFCHHRLLESYCSSKNYLWIKYFWNKHYLRNL